MAAKKKNDEKTIDKIITEEVISTENSNKVENKDVEVIHEESKTIIVRAKKALNKKQFELLSDMLKSENEKTGHEIILMPYSVETIVIK
ncbi:hypothetical protein SH1V18_14960 [Vallitalea longa]|uniref:Uncharacterized protein n=1 Tax=Vallitalea longa TaxID=2936439 RepID=A0A9W5YAA5_9FIRM|nr:hypothetical protein [Vallitalea longa]GKX29016.1 hypothetical protein SH1V18_14960 [Vallitalea longa]